MPAQLSTLEQFPSIVYAERESHNSADYCWYNKPRVPKGTIVIQRTLSGEAVHTGPDGETLIRKDRAMIFKYGEDTSYHIGNPAKWPYQTAYVVLRPQGGIGELAGQIRQDFGDVIHMADSGDAAQHMMALVSTFRSVDKPDMLGLAAIAYQLLIAIYREQVRGTQGTDPVAYLRHLIQNQFRRPSNIKEWMHELPMSREHMTRVFHERYGESPAAYLRRLRLDYARLLARSSSMSATEIAASSGFMSTQTLRRAFRKEYGESLGSLKI